MQLMIKRGGHQRRHLWKSSVLHSSWKKYTFYPISWRYSLKFNAKEVSIVNALSEGAVSAVLPWVFRYHAINLCTKWYSLHTLYVLLWQDVTNRKPSVSSTVGRSAKYRYLNLLSLFKEHSIKDNYSLDSDNDFRSGSRNVSHHYRQ